MSADLSAPTRLAERYLLRERIAVGGMGEVHLATDERLGRQVAVKVLSPGYAGSADFVERFRREALTAAGLGHPNIAHVYDYGVDRGAHFIVMEHVPGADLDRLLRDEGRLDPATAASVAAQVCAALGAAHRAGVVHRDVKPGNVIVTPEGRVKVTDFGIARALGQSSLTDAGMVMGTAAYLSPEQARGGQATPVSDLYSLGILLFQMLTGSAPFAGGSPVDVALRHLDEAVPAPSDLVLGIPAGLDAVVARATAKNPADRFTDADAMADALHRPDLLTVGGRGAGTDAATTALAVAGATGVLGLPDASGPSSAATSRLGAVGAGAGAAGAPGATTRPASGGPAPATRSGSVHDTRRRPGAPRRTAPLVWALVAMALVAVTVLVAMVVTDDAQPSAGAATTPTATRPAPSETTSDEPVPTTTADQPTSEATTTEPQDSKRAVPDDLVGVDVTDARRALEEVDARAKVVEVRAAYEEGQVLATYPRAGRPLREGQQVVLVVSRGGGDAEGDGFVMPSDLVGRQVEPVEKQFEQGNVKVVKVSLPSSRERGTILATYVAAGEVVRTGQVVLITSSGRGDD